ncbi:chromosome partitioning protein, ParB family [Streptomyces sp. 1222.5]|uniref:ParB/RepB/Spo0J family partition protein n=1 Tax=unclassified Streptomyces TaxID=2593676 RepID=UPI000895EF37|nr:MULTISPECIES: ParB/RepB/Spo0J family partition protein [unclassified Streptomyces]PKW00372.1 ParB family chromosome partitioning protein [Streptomyces sp. 5112.2]SED86544.1 chromosome partitioning protein, ParB family [Streptomyces sp. 1222.5]
MSKADQLGAGRFGGGVRPVSARRQAVAAATGVPTDGVAPPGELPPHRISLNPDNPRSSLGDLTDLAGSLKTHGQKQAITVMNRDAYIKVNPERETDLEADTTYVVIDGSSRLAAAREAQLPTIKVMVSDDQGSNSEELLESALVANIHRQDLNELDEARALERLLTIHGSQTALAKRLHRSQGWVSQRLALLKLTPELQSRIGVEPIDLLRAVAGKPVDEQEAALRRLKDERARKEEDRREPPRAQPAPSEEAPGYYGVIEGSASRDSASNDQGAAAKDTGHGVPEHEGYYGVIEEGPSAKPPAPGPATAPMLVHREDAEGEDYYDVIGDGPAEAIDPSAPTAAEESPKQAVPEPRADSSPTSSTDDVTASSDRARKVPYDEPGSLAMLLDTKIESDEVFFSLLEFLNTKAIDRDPARFEELARSAAKQAAARVG